MSNAVLLSDYELQTIAYRHNDNVRLYKVYGDDSITDKPYGVQIKRVKSLFSSYRWFKTQAEQNRCYTHTLQRMIKGEVV